MNNRGDSSAKSPDRNRSTWALAGIVVGFALFNSIATFLWPTNDSPVGFLLLGAMDTQPLLFGMWTALGAGSMVTRFPMATACLMMLFVAPGYLPAAFADIQRRDFIAAVLAGLAVYSVAVILFALFRRFTGSRIISNASALSHDHRVRFSTKYLLILITIVAVVLGLSTQLKFQQIQPIWNFLAPNFYIAMLTFGTAIVTIVTLPTLAVPLAILRGRLSRRAIIFAVVFWLIVVCLLLIFSFIEQGEPLNDLGAALLAQVGAILIGTAAAVPLRVAGMRLVRYE